MKLRTRPPESLPARPASSFFPSRQRSAFFQAKLKVGQAGDRFEREADRVAEQVVAGGNAPPVQMMCAECAEEKEEEPVRRKPSAGSPEGETGLDPGVEQRLSGARGGGEALPPAVESSMSAAFGRDFSGVRVHTDAPAVQLSRDLDAAAFTQGNHVYFGEGQFAPGSAAGQRLLAHELTHVVQQGFAGPAAGPAAAGPVQRQSAAGQLLQRQLMTDGDCGKVTGLPLTEKPQAVARGAHYTETFLRPPKGKVKITVNATAEEGCHADNKFGVNLVQCHILKDENLDEQTTENFGKTLSYEATLPTKEWNTYEKFYVRVFVTCAATVDVKVEAV